MRRSHVVPGCDAAERVHYGNRPCVKSRPALIGLGKNGIPSDVCLQVVSNSALGLVNSAPRPAPQIRELILRSRGSPCCRNNKIRIVRVLRLKL